MEKVVIEAMIHSELKFLTWIFQVGSADRREKWQLGRRTACLRELGGLLLHTGKLCSGHSRD